MDNSLLQHNQHHDPIEQRLAAFSQRWQRVRFRQGAAYTLMVAVLAVLTAAMLDYLLPLSLTQRYFLTLACYSLTILFALFGWLMPAFMPVSPLRIAWMLEKIIPDFNEKLISSVELSSSDNAKVSRELILALLAETETDLAGIQPERAMPLRWRHFLLPLVALIAFAIGLALPNASGRQLYKRVLFPSPRDAEVGAFRLIASEPSDSMFIEDEPLLFAVRSTDASINEVILEIEGNRRRRIPMEPQGKGNFEYTLTDQKTSFTYRFRSGQVATRLRNMQLVRVPRINEISAVYDFPEYTGRQPVRTAIRDGQVKALPGTQVTLFAAFSKPLTEIFLEYDGRRIPGILRPDKAAASVSFALKSQGDMSLRMVDAAEPYAESVYEGKVITEEDASPQITLHKPQDNLLIEAGDQVELEWGAIDDFGIENLVIEIRLNGRKQQELELAAEATTETLDTAEWQLQLGDRLDFRLTCSDGAGQQASTTRRGMLVVQGEDTTRSTAFMRHGERITEELKNAAAEFHAMEPLREQLTDALTYRTSGAVENLQHNRSMLVGRTKRFDQHLAQAQILSGKWMPLSFYPGADRYIGLMRRYVANERISVIPQLPEMWNDTDKWSRTAQLITLCDAMTTNLVSKAGEYQPWLLVNALHEIVLHSAFRNDDLSREWNQRVLERIIPFAKAYEPDTIGAEMAEIKLEQQKSVPQPDGMHYRRYPDVKDYPPLIPDAGNPPEKEGRHKSIRFENSAELGLNKQQTGALHWQGYLLITAPGSYRFFCNSSDGSRLYINHSRIVHNDGRHPMRERDGKVYLERGLVKVDLLYYNEEGEGGMILEWEEPGKSREPFPANAVYSSLGNGALKLAWLTGSLNRTMREKARNHSTLDKLAREMEEALRDPAKELADLARRIDAGVVESPWPAIERMAEKIEEAAAIAPLSEHARALREVADMYQQAADEKLTEPLFAAAERMRRIDELGVMNESVANIAPLLETVDEKISNAQAQVRNENDFDYLAERTAADKISEARRELARAREQQVGDERLEKAGVMRGVRDELSKADKALNATETAIRSGNNEESKTQMQSAREALEAADRKMRESRQNAIIAAREAAEELAALQEDPSGKVEQVAHARAELATDLRKEQRPDIPALENSLEKIRREDEILEDAAGKLRRKALNAFSGETPDARDAAANMALAQRIEAARNDSKALAREISAAQDALRTPETSSPEHQLAARKIAEEHMEQAALQADRIAESLMETAALAEKHQAAKDGLLSANEQAESVAQLAQITAETLPKELQAELARMENIAEHKMRAEQLAETLEDKRINEQERKNVSHELAQIEEALAHLPLADSSDNPLLQSPAQAIEKKIAISSPQLDSEPLLNAVEDMRNTIEKARIQHELPLEKALAAKRRPEAEALGLLLSTEPAENEKKKWQETLDDFHEHSPGRQAGELRALADHLPNEKKNSAEKMRALADELSSAEKRYGDPAQHERNLQRAAADAARKTRDLQRAAASLPESERNALQPLIEKVGKNTERADFPKALGGLNAIERSIEDAALAQRSADDQEPALNEGEKIQPQEAARTLAEAMEYKQRHIQPLEKAYTMAEQNRFAEAAAQAAKTPFGDTARQELKLAEKALRAANDAAKDGLRQADAPEEQQAYSKAAEHLAARQPDKAAEVVSTLPADDNSRKTLDSIKQAQAQRDAALPALMAALDEAKALEPDHETVHRQAEQLADSLRAELEKQQADYESSQQRAEKLTQAAHALEENNVPEALANVKKAARTSQASDPQQSLEEAAAALSEAGLAQQQARREAAQAAKSAGNQPDAEKLIKAAEEIAKGRFEQAREAARQAEKPGATLKKIDEAEQQHAAALEQLEKAAERMHQFAEQADRNLQKAKQGSEHADAARKAFDNNELTRAAVETARIPEAAPDNDLYAGGKFEKEARQAADNARRQTEKAVAEAIAARNAAENDIESFDEEDLPPSLPAIAAALQQGEIDKAAEIAAGDPEIAQSPLAEKTKEARAATQEARKQLQRMAAANEALEDTAQAAKHDMQQGQKLTEQALSEAKKGDLNQARKALDAAREVASRDNRPTPAAAAARHAMEQLTALEENKKQAHEALQRAKDNASRRGEKKELQTAAEEADKQNFATAAEHADNAGSPAAEFAAEKLAATDAAGKQAAKAIESAQQAAQAAEQAAEHAATAAGKTAEKVEAARNDAEHGSWDAAAEKMQQAQAQAADTPAENQVSKAAQAAQKAAVEAGNAQRSLQAAAQQAATEQAREQLQKAAQQAEAGNYDAAAEQAQTAGETGKQAASALKQASKAAAQAQTELSAAQQAAQQAQAAAQQQASSAKQAQQNINNAQNAMQQGLPQAAQQAMAAAHRAARQSVPPRTPSQVNAEMAQLQLQQTADAMQLWAQPSISPDLSSAEIPSAARIAAHSGDPEALNAALDEAQLPPAARALAAPVAEGSRKLPEIAANLEQSASMAQNEAIQNQQSAEAFENALKAAERITSELDKNRMDQALKRIPDMADALAAIPPEYSSETVLPSISDYAQTDYPSAGLEQMHSNSELPTGDMSTPLDQAIPAADTAQQPSPPAGPQAVQPSPAAQAAQPMIDQARNSLQNAAQQAALPQSTQQAAQSAQQAAQSMSQAAQQMAAQSSQQAGLAQIPSMQEGGAGSGGGSHAPARQDYQPLGKRDMGDSWGGAEGRLHSMDTGEQTRRYTPYYQRAMKSYLERVAKERTATQK